MFFRRRIWLWLYIRTAIILGGELNIPEQHGKKHCYQLNRFHCSYEEAENYCRVWGGHLAYTWNLGVQDLLWDFLEEGSKWWIGPHLKHLGKHQERKNPAGVAAHRPPKPPGCTYMSRNSNWISSEADSCSLGHSFICQADQDERHGNNSNLHWRPEKTEGEAIQPLSLCAFQSKTLCHPISPFPSTLPKVTRHVLAVTSAPTSPPLPGPPALTRQALVEVTPSPKEDSQAEVFTTHLQTSLQDASDQVVDEIGGNLGKPTDGLQPHSKVQTACEMLQKLTAFIPGFSKSAQVNVLNPLVDLNEQLPERAFEGNSSRDFENPITVCLIHSVGNVIEAGEAGLQRSKQDIEQVENMLEMALLALGKIQEAFLQENGFSESLVTLTSSVATLVLSSQNMSSWPLSSYTLRSPAPVRLGFPSASALQELLNRHPGVNVQVTGLAFNPFRDFDDKNIVGSIGSVLLSSNHNFFQVDDLMEDIEIMLWRNVSMEIHPTSLNVSSDHFIIMVNITSLEKSLIVCIEPESPLLMTLYLGFQYQPNHTHFDLNITLPKNQVWQKDEEYTWVLTPESLRYGTGTYHITAALNKSKESARQTPTLFSVVTAVTQCYFWDSHNSTWKSGGCHVGPQSTVLRTQCLCNRLAYFGSDFVVVPRTVNTKDTIKLFLRVTNNPVGVSLLASLFGFYLLTCVWAWRKDQADTQKVKVTVLADNDPSSQFHYLLQVSTGYRRKAATTAKVVITLYGSEGRSEPHHLCDPQKAVFERGGLDVFLLSTQSSLGELHGLWLWHDNSGASPSWYVNQVIVSDMAGKRKWYFLCNCWLAVDLGEHERDRVFMPVSEKELFSFRHLFSTLVVEKLTQDYLWLSVLTRHPWNQFTRVQRLTCCMTLLLCNMVVNVMFWKRSSTTAERDEQVGPFPVTWSQLIVSIQTAVLLFPVNLVIGSLFPLIQPQEPLPVFPPSQASCPSDATFEPLSLTKVAEELKETVGFLLRRNTYLLSEWEQSLWTSRNISKMAQLLASLICSHLKGHGSHQQAGPHQANAVPESHHHLCCYLLRVLQRLQSHLRALGPTPANQPRDVLDATNRLQNLQELLETHIFSTDQGPSREATSFPILSPEEGKKPVANGLPRGLICISWLLLGVTGLAAAFFTALYSLDLTKDQATSWVTSVILSVLHNLFISQPVKAVFLALFVSLVLTRMPWLTKEKEQQTRRILALWAKCPPLTGSRDKNNPVYIAPAINSPVARPKRTLKEKKLFRLTGDILVQILFLTLLMTTVYSAQNSNRFYLHQAIQKSFSHRFSEIRLLKHFYLWANRTLLPNLYGDYRGTDTALGPSLLDASWSIFSTSFQHFVDGQRRTRTRMLFPPLCSWHLRQVWYVCTQCLSTEGRLGGSVGGFFPSLRLDTLTSLQASKKDFAWSVISQVIYYLLVCYYAFVQGHRLKQQRWRFFTRKRNILDTSTILISFVLLGLDVKLTSLHKKNMARYHYDRGRFISFYEAIKVNSAVLHLMGFLVLLATVQLWNLLQRNPRLQVIGRSLSEAWDEVVGFLLVILILLTGYAITFNLLFGWSVSDYQTFFSSAVTVVGLLMGISHHEEVIALDPILGSFLIFTSVFLMVLVIINLFVSVILMAFGKERKSLKVEGALIKKVLQRLSSLLGIQRHQNT
uniref:Polycystin 1 like 3, transient receptor potential channel interacting n=1 Tax=Ursus americanus TaxID=9643 RepID=A0A452S2L8_URSAM